MIRDFGICAAAFVVATLLAELFGATNLGTALTFGSIAYMGAIVALILLRGPRARPEAETAPKPAVRTAPKPSGRSGKRR